MVSMDLLISRSLPLVSVYIGVVTVDNNTLRS